MPDVCTAGDVGDVCYFEVDGERALSDIDSSMTSDVNAILANTKGNPNSNCYLMGRRTVNWSFNLKVPCDEQSSVFTKLWTHHWDKTLATITWGPFNNMMVTASVFINNMTPTVTTEAMASATMSGVTQGEISYVQL